MTPSERAELQSAMLSGMRASKEDRPSQRAVADALGFDETEYKRFKDGKRKFDIDEIVAACEEYGVDAVLAPLAARFRRRLVAEGAVGAAAAAPELGALRAQLVHATAEFDVALERARADGIFTDDEVAGLHGQQASVHAAAWRLCMQKVRAGRAA